MKPLAKKASPAAIAVLRQATALWPKRKKLSDGLLPSLAHQQQNPNSDHNTGLAVDLTHDPANGVDCKDIFQKIKRDRRVVYLIFAGKIWSKERAADGDRDYNGINKHKHHLHISINADFANDTSSWFGWMEKPSTISTIKAAIKPLAKKTQSS
jgi:hypothetical protein